MKISSLMTAFALVMISLASNATPEGNIATACARKANHLGVGYTLEIIIAKNRVTVNYYNLQGKREESYGTSFVSGLKVQGSNISIPKISLNDGDDSWMDNMQIDITNKTVRFAKAGTPAEASPRLAKCPSEK